MSEIEKFVKETYENCLSYTSGYSLGLSYTSGYRSGSGSGKSLSSGSGDSSGSGNSFGSRIGFGSGGGFGYSYGIGKDIKSFNGFPVYLIDDIQTGIISAKGNVAKGFILYNDLTTKPCYIVKDNNGIYAHGETLKEAETALREKQLEKMPVEERIQLFKEHFEADKLYKGQEFYDWHHTLTGSCKMGRDKFCEEHGINLESEYTVKEFIELTENSYGGEIIKKLKDMYKIYDEV